MYTLEWVIIWAIIAGITRLFYLMDNASSVGFWDAVAYGMIWPLHILIALIRYFKNLKI